MREYKFRGISIEPLVGDGQWVYGFGVHVVELADGGNEYWLFTENGTYQVDPDTVGQYTGLKDNVNDEEWYEGDVITPNPHSERTELEVICYDRHQGRYKAVPISFYRSNAGNGGWTGYDLKSYQKRVGNIYDNPDLLEASA